MRRSHTALVLVVLLFGWAACQKQSGAGGAQETRQSPAKPAVQPSPWKMSLTVGPAQPTSEADSTFRLKLTDLASAPVEGAEVKADLKMTLMDMGMNVVNLADKGSGTYEGKGRFSMTGPWDVIVTASKNGKSGTQIFPVAVRK